MHQFMTSEKVQRVVQLRLPRFDQLPTLDLYMDQVISVVNTAVKPLFYPEEGNILTPTMVGNYVKQKMIPPPVKKKYSREQVAYCIAVVLLKQVYSMGEVKELIQRQMQTVSVEEAYNFFCQQVELSIQTIFRQETAQFDPESVASGSLEPIRFVVSSLAHKIYVQKYLEYIKSPEKTSKKV